MPTSREVYTSLVFSASTMAIEIAVDMGVPVINTEFSGDPNQQEICNGMFFKSMEELLPIIEREGIRVECQSHPYDFVELNDEACDIVKSFRSKNLGYVYSASHGFFYDQGKGDVRHMLKYAGDELTHVLLADTWNQTKDCRYIVNPPWLNQRGRYFHKSPSDSAQPCSLC